MVISITLHQWWFQYHSNHLPQLPINHLPLVSFARPAEGVPGCRSIFEDKWVIMPTAKNTITNCLLFPCVTPAFSSGLQTRTQPSIKICFPTIRIGRGTVSHGIPLVGVGRGKERREGRVMCNTLKRRVLHLALSGGLLTWGNICCVEMETDDSNYMQSEGLPAKMENVMAENMDRQHPFNPVPLKRVGLNTQNVTLPHLETTGVAHHCAHVCGQIKADERRCCVLSPHVKT